MTDSSTPLRSAVVGCRMGARHAEVMAALPEFEVAAVCDLDLDLAEKLAGELEATAYTDFEEMLAEEQLGTVAVATPNDSHAELTIRAAEAGVRGVCCEKPMATCMGEGRAMVEACRSAGAQLIVNHQRRMSPPLVRMRELIEQGAIGEPYLYRGDCAGDILSDGTHLVDSLRWLAGDEEVHWVFGQVYREQPDPDEEQGTGYTGSGGYRYGHPVETGGFGVFEFESGARAEMLTGEMRSPGRVYQDYEIFGTEGRLRRKGDRADPPVLIQDSRAGGWHPVEIEDGEHAMRASYRAFARMIREGGEHPLCGDSALRDLEVVMAVYESARTRSRLELPLEQDAFPLALMVAEGQL